MTEEKVEKKKIKIFVAFLVLIIVMFTAFLIYENKDENKEEEQIVKIEALISEYEGDTTSGEDVKIMLAQLMGVNGQEDISKVEKIEYNILDLESKSNIGEIDVKANDVLQFVDLRGKIDNEKKYKVKFQKNFSRITSIKIEE